MTAAKPTHSEIGEILLRLVPMVRLIAILF
jgi:hypothetical protein